MVLVGSGFSAVFSSSCMPFLKALMPCATSPIKSEILPRPNSSRTTAITTIQCQMLSEPILQPSKHEWPASRPDLLPKVGAQALKNKDFGHVKRPRQLRLAATVNRHNGPETGGKNQLPPSPSGSTRGDSASSRSPAPAALRRPEVRGRQRASER